MGIWTQGRGGGGGGGSPEEQNAQERGGSVNIEFAICNDHLANLWEHRWREGTWMLEVGSQ